MAHSDDEASDGDFDEEADAKWENDGKSNPVTQRLGPSRYLPTRFEDKVDYLIGVEKGRAQFLEERREAMRLKSLGLASTHELTALWACRQEAHRGGKGM